MAIPTCPCVDKKCKYHKKHENERPRLINKSQDNRFFICPETGHVYYNEGNRIILKEPEWERKNINSSNKYRILSYKMKIASKLNSENDPKAISSYINELNSSGEISNEEAVELKTYAKIGFVLNEME